MIRSARAPRHVTLRGAWRANATSGDASPRASFTRRALATMTLAVLLTLLDAGERRELFTGTTLWKAAIYVVVSAFVFFGVDFIADLVRRRRPTRR